MSAMYSTQIGHAESVGSAAVRRPGLRHVLSWILRRIEDAFERRRQRRDLLALSDDQLKDIGISRSMAHREASRPFWK